MSGGYYVDMPGQYALILITSWASPSNGNGFNNDTHEQCIRASSKRGSTTWYSALKVDLKVDLFLKVGCDWLVFKHAWICACTAYYCKCKRINQSPKRCAQHVPPIPPSSHWISVFGVFLVCVWCVFGVCLVCFWCVFGVFLELKCVSHLQSHSRTRRLKSPAIFNIDALSKVLSAAHDPQRHQLIPQIAFHRF